MMKKTRMHASLGLPLRVHARPQRPCYGRARPRHSLRATWIIARERPGAVPGRHERPELRERAFGIRVEAQRDERAPHQGVAVCLTRSRPAYAASVWIWRDADLDMVTAIVDVLKARP